MRHAFLATGSLALATVLPAQLTISDGNSLATVGLLSTTSQTPRSFVLRGDALATDHGYEHAWYYRIVGDSRELSLRNVGTVVEGVAPGLDHLDRDFMDVDARGLLRASQDLDVYDAGPASGVVMSRLTVMNISASPVTVDLFCYTDLDIADTASDDTVTGTAGSHFVSDPTGVQIEVRALGSDASDVGAYPAIRNLLTNTVVNDLGNNLPPFVGDYTGAFQWQNRTLQPFEQRTFTVVMAIDTAAVAVPLVENYGRGNGAFGEIHSQTVPLQDNAQPRLFSIGLKNAQPNQIYRTCISFAPYNAAPFIGGLDFWVDPFVLIGVWGIGGLTSPTGEAVEVFTVPPSPYLAGFSVYCQSFYVDGSAPNGFAYYTPGLKLRIGKI